MLRAVFPARPRRLAMVMLAVLAAHALLLAGLDVGLGVPHRSPSPALQVREIVLASPPAPAVEAADTRAPTPVPARPRPSPRPARSMPLRPAMAVVEVPTESADVADAAPSATGAGPEVPVDAALVVAAAASAPVLAADAPALEAETPPPTYPTRLPPTATLRYDLRRGGIGGSGELRWVFDAGRYELRLEGTVIGIPVLSQVSRGTIDAAGVAPDRFTDQRVRRAMQAANFRRDVHKVTFSGPSKEVLLHEGAQDRLSWMVQLAGIAAADPARRDAGAKVALQVVGARGDSSIWVFRCMGRETVASRGGAVDTVRYAREPRGPYDTAVEVWLDPARYFLPLRATMRNGEDRDGFELRLRDATVGG